MHEPPIHADLRIPRMRLTALSAGAALAGSSALQPGWANAAPATPQMAPAASDASQPTVLQPLTPDFADLVIQVKPAVVSTIMRVNANGAADDAAAILPGFTLGEHSSYHAT